MEPHQQIHVSHTRELTKSPARTLLSWLGVLAFIVICAAILFWKVQSNRADMKKAAEATRTPEAVLTVEISKASVTAVPDVVKATGSVTAKDPLEISAEVSGLKVEQVLVEEGDYVLEGQVLAVLNRSLLEAQLTQAQARYRSGQAQISKALQPNRVQDINRLKAAYAQARAQVTQENANLQQAQALLRNAEETSRRYQQVLGQGYVTAQEAADRASNVSQNQAAVAAARQRYQASQYAAEQARHQLDLAQVGGRAEDVEIARASNAETAGVIQQLEAQLRQTVIHAPDAGWVLTRTVHLGEISSSTKVMFTLARRSQLELKAEVPQAELLKLRPDMLAGVSFGKVHTQGRVWQVSPAVNEQTRLGQARILLDPASGLKPGMFAEASISAGTHRALTVPAAAVQGEGGDYFVFKLVEREGNRAKVKRHSVKTGVRTNKIAEITEGVKAGEEIVSNGGNQLNDEDHVQVAP